MGLLTGIYNKSYAALLAYCTVFFNDVIEPEKKKLFKDLHEKAKNEKEPLRLLEIGAGSGANFKFYPKGVKMVCLEPKVEFAPHMEASAKKDLNAESLELVHAYARDLEMFEDNSFDAVIITLVLCSIDDLKSVLTAVKRVLKPVSNLRISCYFDSSFKSTIISIWDCFTPLS